MSKGNNKGRRNMPSSKYVINDKIRAKEVRVVEGLTPGIYSTEDAIKQADNAGLDLVAINSNVSPVICKAVNFNKFLYEEKRREKNQGKNQTKIIVKEMKFTPNIGDNDFEVKKKKVIEFLEKGYKVKASVFFKGRSIVYKDRGELILVKLASEIEDIGVPEGIPKMESKNRMGFIIKSKKKS